MQNVWFWCLSYVFLSSKTVKKPVGRACRQAFGLQNHQMKDFSVVVRHAVFHGLVALLFGFGHV